MANIIQPAEIKGNFKGYMEKSGYRLIAPDSLVSETFPTCFTVSGGPNFVDRYLKGECKNAESSVVIQPCHRFWDVNSVGDGSHLSFFEMAVTNSLNGKSREEMYKNHLDFLTNELGLNKDYFNVSVFGGGNCDGKEFQRDEEAIKIWEKFGLKKFTVYPGFDRGPQNRLTNESFVANAVEPVGGPRTEIFYKGHEIWTSVLYNNFVKYDEKNNRFEFKPIEDSTIAAGFGVERVAQAVNGLKSIDEVYPSKHTSDPVISDHVRGLIFLAKDGAFELAGNKNNGRKTLLNRYIKNLFLHLNSCNKEIPQEELKRVNEDVLRSLIAEGIANNQYDQPELVGREIETLDKIERRARRLNLI